jgi:hypothetical protein
MTSHTARGKASIPGHSVALTACSQLGNGCNAWSAADASPARQVCCTRECGNRHGTRKLTELFRHARAVKAGRAAALSHHARLRARWEAMIARLGSLESCRRAYSAGYEAGRRARRSVEISDGMRLARSLRESEAA